MKRIIAALLLTAVLTTAGALPARSDSRPGGDANGDGLVSASDAATALRAAYGLIKLDNASALASDVTGNLTVGGTDAQAILMLQTGWINAFSELSEIPANSLIGEKYFEQFSYVGTRILENAYLSSRVSVRLNRRTYVTSSAIVADVYVHSLESLSTAFSGDEYNREHSLETVPAIADRRRAILAVNGDFYSQRSTGPMVRNGTWYREKVSNQLDLLVLYQDGTMETVAAGNIDVAHMKQRGVWQTWLYGPKLLDDAGAPARYFNATNAQSRRSARTAVGYYAPGHYCIILVEGKQAGDSTGMSLPELAEFCASLGLKAAYNLTGGESAVLYFNGRVVSRPETDPGRTISDILYLAEPAAGGGA